MQMIYDTRGRADKSGAAAERWLSWVTTEACVQLAMLADAGD